MSVSEAPKELTFKQLPSPSSTDSNPGSFAESGSGVNMGFRVALEIFDAGRQDVIERFYPTKKQQRARKLSVYRATMLTLAREEGWRTNNLGQLRALFKTVQLTQHEWSHMIDRAMHLRAQLAR